MNSAKKGTAAFRLGDDRLLNIADIADITGLCPATASRLIKETGRAIILHRRVYILESSLVAYLHEMEASEDGR